MREIRALTSLRGVAALWVFLFHLDVERPLPQAFRAALAVDRGYVAVDLFFVLSGFVLALTHRDMFRTQRFQVAYPDFLRRRVARVMPLNWAIIVVIVLSVRLSPLQAADSFAAARDPGAAIANFFLVQDWGFAPSIDKPSWSVSIEMAVYLAFPLLVALAWSRRAWFPAMLAGAAALCWLSMTGHGVVSQGLLVGDFIRGFAGFMFGLLCFRAVSGSMLPPTLGRFDLAVLTIFWASLLLSPIDLPPILICPAIVLTLAFERGPLARFLSLGPLHYLGQLSYSIYLVHYCVLGGLNLLPIGSGALYGGIALGLTLAISACTYRWIEAPARRLLSAPHLRPSC
jgi:peptidoglycan/LPS O-acetylase OafA/YrhL